MSLSRNLGTLTSWNPLSHSRPVKGLLYLYLYFRQATISRLTGAMLYFRSVPLNLGQSNIYALWFHTLRLATCLPTVSHSSTVADTSDSDTLRLAVAQSLPFGFTNSNRFTFRSISDFGGDQSRNLRSQWELLVHTCHV